MVFCSGFLRFLIYSSCWLLTICYRRFLRTWYREEDQESLLERIRLEYQRADLEVKIGHLEADVAYFWSDYLFQTEGAKKDALFVAICGLDSEVERLETKLSSLSGQLYYFRQFFEVEPSCVSVNLWCAILFIFSFIPVWLVFWSFFLFRNFVWVCRGDDVLTFLFLSF